MDENPNGTTAPAETAPPAAATPEAAAPVAPEAKDAAAPAAPQAQQGDATEGQVSAGEPFAIAAPEGAEAYQAEFDRFAGDMDGWLKANPNATAREALAEAASRQARVAGESQAAVAQQRNDQIGAWEGELRADKEFGGEAYDANVATAIKGLEAVGSPELRQVLDQTGMGSHPEIVRAFKKVGELVADAPFATSAQPAQSAKSAASRMYPNMKQ